MVNQIGKTTIEIKDRMEFWFLKYFGEPIENFTRKEPFTLYESLELEEKTGIEARIELYKLEMPVYFLRITNDTFIVNTTERFIRYENGNVETIKYSDFERNIGFRPVGFYVGAKPISTKMEGYISDFELKKTDGTTLKWQIPTGKFGYGFWNVTQRCAFVGKKFVNLDHK